MKLLFENWRKYLNERIDGGPPPKRTEYDVGTAFPEINVQDIVESPTKNTITKIALLNIFNQLESEPDDSKIKHILYSMQKMSGNSPDFSFKSKEDAIKFYRTPYKYKTTPTDSKPTKSLQDWHEHLKVINTRTGDVGWSIRSEKIKAFYADSSRQKPTQRRKTNPFRTTDYPIAKTINQQLEEPLAKTINQQLAKR